MLNDLNQRGGKHRALCPKHLKENRQRQAKKYYHNRKEHKPGWWDYWQKRNHENYQRRKLDAV